MSALGQNRTFHAAVRESALPPKADIIVQCNNVRLVPQADIASPRFQWTQNWTLGQRRAVFWTLGRGRLETLRL